MKLKDIYPQNFWNKFNILSNEEIDKILQIDIADEKFKINIDLICNILNIQMLLDFFSHSLMSTANIR